MSSRKFRGIGLTILTIFICCFMCGCGGESEQGSASKGSVMQTDYITIEKLAVDDSFKDSSKDSLRLVYVYYTFNAKDKNTKISSKGTTLKIGENEYTSGRYFTDNNYMPNLYYSDYLEEVMVGENLKVLLTFKVPEGDLVSGKEVKLEESDIPTISDIKFKTDDFEHLNGNDAVAQYMDEEGYKAELVKYEDADEETVKKVKKLINGYEWSFYVNNISYKLSFESPNKFQLITVYNKPKGVYTVKKGYILCRYPDTGKGVDIPYSFKDDGDIKLDVVKAFDVRQ